MKKIYSKLIIISVMSLFVIAIFYLSTTINSSIKIANRDLEVGSFIKREVDLSKQDFKEYNINDKIFNTKLFQKFKDYKNISKIEKGREDIFYKEKEVKE